MKSPVFRIATSPRIKEPSLLVTDSVELFTNTSKVQTTRAGRKIDHTNLPIEINAVFDVRRQKRHFSYAYQRKSIHFNFPIELDANNGKDFPMFRDDKFYSTVRFLILTVMLNMGLRRAVQPSLPFRPRLLAAQHCYHSQLPDPLPAEKSLLQLILATQDRRTR